jgi:hypothetical protein
MLDIVKLEFKISGSDSFKEVEVSAKDLAEAIAFIPLNPRSSKTARVDYYISHAAVTEFQKALYFVALVQIKHVGGFVNARRFGVVNLQ